ncbi:MULTISPECIES: class I SAM-dependent methyltransferase [Rhodococcus]|uniref:class I SAM-dependent methyltransferase n=1 Tax=Rhodococcus TaxID=1827 RepID=UPI00193B161B|nr:MULTISPECIES: class I SAM-dependent methyltransferase [Rhodococcus]QRI78610.1 methyltransferase domain-containing protein [Rhodococcus aetherivorans]QSE57078.1 methyltransferase domain-containing protein [Rhodococcus sp. PSBB066]QSE71584.1 methyltransferase domain-containing protein [Rhodococcus sp. PSBB049]
MSDSRALPMSERDSAHLPGHWLLARLGKRVLRPGGAGMTTRLLVDADIEGSDVVELAPGLGRTAREILDLAPLSYTGVEHDEAAAELTRAAIGDHGRCVVADAAATGLPDAGADVVVGEAMLTMQTDAAKARIVAEAVRTLRPGGRYAIHELALVPDELDDAVKTEIRQGLARSIKVNARPLTVAEWRTLLTEAGLSVDVVRLAPMALLQPARFVADEGVLGTLRFVRNVLRDGDARTRVLGMRATFTTYRRSIAAVAIVATKPR